MPAEVDADRVLRSPIMARRLLRYAMKGSVIEISPTKQRMLFNMPVHARTV